MRNALSLRPEKPREGDRKPQAPTAGGASSTSGFTINGRTYSQDGVARLLARLALVPHLTNVTLQHSSAATSETGRKVVEFTINATVKGVGA